MLFFLLNIFLLSSPASDDVINWTVRGDLQCKQNAEVTYNNSTLDNWATKNLRNCDIISRKGRFFVGPIDFPDYISKISQSEYSHCGLVWLFGGKAYVFDMDESGCRKVPFEYFMRESVSRRVLIQRVKPKYDYVIPQVLTSMWNIYLLNTKFDYAFVYGGSSMYCTEFVHRAYASAKLCLQNPVKIGDLPGIAFYPLKTFLVMYGNRFYTNNPIDFSRKVVFPGNRKVGIISSNKLFTIFEGEL